MTKKSWWVPFEIGMATEKDMPIANYLVSSVELPDYLDYWPRLRDSNDVYQYVKVRNEISKEYSEAKHFFESTLPKPCVSETQEFYRRLKQQLR